MNKRTPLYQKIVTYLAVHWQRTLVVFFTGVFIGAFIHWSGEEINGMLPTTRKMVYLTMLITLLTEMFALKNKLLQRLLQWLLITGLHVVMLDFTLITAKVETFSQFMRLVYYNIEPLYPYYWFSMGVWVIYLAASWWMQRKLRIAIAMVLGVLAMALRDSFSMIYLWDEAAVMILSGLFLLVTAHFAGLKKKNPQGWGYIADYPVSFLTPIVLLLTLTVGVGTMFPDVRNVLTDPYTLYKHWEGETVNLGGKVPTTPVDIAPSFRSSSGYGRDDSSLGGGFSFDYTEVFKVDTSHRSYWRGETKALYTGEGWENSEREKSLPLTEVEGSSAGKLAADPLMKGSKLKTVDVEQTITFADNANYPVLFGALSISAMDQRKEEGAEAAPNGKVGTLSWDPVSSELWIGGENTSARQRKLPKTYAIVSKMPVLDEAGLRTAPFSYDKSELTDYLQLPTTLPPRVKKLTEEITANANNPYDKVKAIEKYLQTTFPYTNEPNEHQSGSEDFVDRFLFETMEGYCDYFSTAMAVMSRTIGMPTRWVKGFTSGTNARDSSFPEEIMRGDMEPDPKGAGVYTVHNSNAHSWVEVYFEGWGWLPFEPTSGFSVPYADAPNVPTEPTAPVDTEPVTPDKPVNDEGGLSTGLWVAIGGFLLVLAAGGVWFFAGYRKERWLIPWKKLIPGRVKSEATNRRLMIKEYEKLLRYSKRRGLPVYEHETARETFTRWYSKDSFLARDLNNLLPLYEKARYSPRSVTAEDVARAAGLVTKLRKEL